MKLSRCLWKTFKETPSATEISSHGLMIRAGLIHKLGQGLYTSLPLGLMMLRKIENIVREEMKKIDGEEICLPMVTPGSLWRESGRWDKMGRSMLKMTDRSDRELCLSPTNEESVVSVFRSLVKSYKQLPNLLYQINTKYRDEIRPRFGMMRACEFVMKDAYSFHRDRRCQDEMYEKIKDSYCRIIERIGLQYSIVEADAGTIGEAESRTDEFHIITDVGEDEIIFCPKTSWAANRETACTKRNSSHFVFESQEIREVETLDVSTILEVMAFLDILGSHCLKSLLYKETTGGSQKYILFQLLGDDTLNEVKAKNYLRADTLVPVTKEEMSALNIPRGFIGPYDRENLLINCDIIFDKAIDLEAYYVVGALKKNYHLKGFCPKRDLSEITSCDLRTAVEGDKTWDGDDPVIIKRGIEVAHIFQLGEKYTRSMDAKVLDENGRNFYPLMGCYGIGIGRLLSAVIEQNHDGKGILCPMSIAPFSIHFIVIGRTEGIVSLGEEIYDELTKGGLDILFDDRLERTGSRFKDADLLGLPLQLILGEKNFKKEGDLELIFRKTERRRMIPRKEILRHLLEIVSEIS